ncbi:hypothetical protein B0H13DRAFT_2299288 [Mycena leptocephala]|nr:hypothetical protein B0H13DRAFT_2299288 [Mycena leptocephala]
MPGPWLHPKTVAMGSTDPAKRPSVQDLADILARNNPTWDPSHCLLFTTAVQQHAETALHGLSDFDKQTAQYELGITSVKGVGMLNNQTIPAIRDGVLPLLALDALLHASLRLTEIIEYVHLICLSAQKIVTFAGSLEAVAIANQPDTNLANKPRPVASALSRLKHLNNSHDPGSGAAHNITQIVFMLKAIMQVLSSFFELQFFAANDLS